MPEGAEPIGCSGTGVEQPLVSCALQLAPFSMDTAALE
jgi:hypothetical protein